MLEKLLHTSQLFVYVHTEKFSEAAVVAKTLVQTFEVYPILLSWTRQPGAIHSLLDSALLLIGDEFQLRIIALKQATPQALLDGIEADINLRFNTSIHEKLQNSLLSYSEHPPYTSTSATKANLLDEMGLHDVDPFLLFQDPHMGIGGWMH
jgi:hypothetical protein